MRLGDLLSLIPMLALGGCAAAPPRPPEVAAAGETILAAEVAGARQDLSASLYLSRAGDEMRLARVALGRGDVVATRAWAMQSHADAEVARLMALEIQARRAAQRGWDEVRRLEDQLDRKLLWSSPAPMASP